MVLDGEQHEALGVLLQQRLVGLGLLDGGSNALLLLGLGLLLDQLLLGLLDGNVLLVGVAKVELLDGRLDLERLDSRGGLYTRWLARSQLVFGLGQDASRHTALEGVTLVAIVNV